MKIFASVFAIALRRLVGNWRLMSSIVVGVIIAVALMASTTIYTDALDDLGLDFALSRQRQVDLNLKVETNYVSSTASSYQRRQQIIDSTLQQTVGWLVRDKAQYGGSATFYLTPSGTPLRQDDGRPRSFFQFLSGLRDHVRLTAGQWPSPATQTDTGAPRLQVLLGQESATRLGVQVGDRFEMYPFWRDDVQPVEVEVSGLIEPLDRGAEYWMGRTDYFAYQSRSWDTYPFFVTEEDFFQALAAYVPEMTSNFATYVYIDTSLLNARNADDAANGIAALGRSVAAEIDRASVATILPGVISEYKDKLFFSSIPVLVVILQMVGIVLYYLVMVSTMLVEKQAGEVALLKSRGARTWQVMLIYGMEGLILAGIGVGVGPLLAAAITSFVGTTPAFRDLTGGDWLEVNLSLRAYLFAVGGAALALLALLWPAYRATRYSIVQHRQSTARPPQAPVFIRYYLDVALVAFGALIFWELRRRGTLVTETVFGEREQDFLLLVSPAVFVVTVGLLFLRLFPLILRFVVWAVGRLQGAALSVGMWHMARTPVHHTRLILLLIMATSLGVFSATFGATLDKSYQERAAYQSGSEIRVEGLRRPTERDFQQLGDLFQQIPGVEVASPAVRTSGSVSVSRFLSESFDLLAIDPATFTRVAWFRDDLAGKSLAELVEPLTSDRLPDTGVALPKDARYLGIWINLPEPTQVAFAIRVQDARGRYFDYRLADYGSQPAPEGWHFAYIDLAQPSAALVRDSANTRPEPPLRVQSVSARPVTIAAATRGRALFDDLQTTADTGSPPTLGDAGFADAVVIEDFEDISEWEVSRITGIDLPDAFTQYPTESVSGRSAGQFSWGGPARGSAQVSGRRGFQARIATLSPLAIVVNRGLLAETGLREGDSVFLSVQSERIPATVVGAFDYFPTFDATQRDGFILANIDQLLTYVNSGSRSGYPLYANEMWLRPKDEMRGDVLAALAGGDFEYEALYDLDEIRLTQNTDPLAAAGWKGILFISFLAVLLLSSLGFLVYSYLTAQQRALEFAILRTLGLSLRQVAGVVSLEQIFVIGVGMALGTALGLPLGNLMLEYMGITETGQTVLPPFVRSSDWRQIISAYAILGGVFIATIAAVVLLYSRLALSRVLRMGEQ